MPTNEMFDLLPHDATWGHAIAHDADGQDLHYVKRGHGSPLVLLLHGWPGFWYDWRRILPRLGQLTSVIAMDLRGFGAPSQLAPITCPTAVVWGEADPILPPSWADRLQDYFPQLVGVHFLAGIGHFVPFEAPDSFIESIRTVL